MKRTTSLAYLGTLSLFATGCIDAAYAQSSTPTWLDEQIPRTVLYNVPSQENVAAQWQLPMSNPWAAYEKLTLASVIGGSAETVTLPSIDDLEEVRLAEIAAHRVAHEGVANNAMWMVDLRGAASVAFGSTLSHYARQPVAIIPTFNNWPFQDELIPAEETLAAMIARPPRISVTEEGSARPVFLLDSWRLAYKDETIEDEVVDNRYMLSTADFPSPEKLRQYGLTHVIYVVSELSEALYEEDDLNALFLAYQEAGIAIHIVDVVDLARERDLALEPSLYFDVEAHHYIVRPRRTVVNSPDFYARARGGFGGAGGIPTIWSPSYLANGLGGYSHGGHGGG